MRDWKKLSDNRKNFQNSEECDKMLDEDVVKELVEKTLEKRKLTCPWSEEILRMKHETRTLRHDEIPFIRKMLWGVMLMLFTVLLSGIVTLIITARVNGDVLLSMF